MSSVNDLSAAGPPQGRMAPQGGSAVHAVTSVRATDFAVLPDSISGQQDS